MDEKQLLAELIRTAEQQGAENTKLLAALGKAAQKMENIVPGIQKAAGEAISVEARLALAGATKAAVGVTSTLKTAAQWFSWKVFVLAAAGLAGVCFVAWGSIWWPRHQIETLIEQKATLQIEVAELRENVAALAKKGGRIKQQDCGGRLCIEASIDQGKNTPPNWGDGLWKNTKSGAILVIVDGY
jgi:hypothetical protein